MNLDFLSIDPGSIFFTLINTLILFLVIKHFLFKPVNKMLEERKDDIALTYSKADNALEKAKEAEEHYNKLISGARDESADIIKAASEKANRRSEEILNNAKADAIQIKQKLNVKNSLQEVKYVLKYRIWLLWLLQKLLIRKSMNKTKDALLMNLLKMWVMKHESEQRSVSLCRGCF